MKHTFVVVSRTEYREVSEEGVSLKTMEVCIRCTALDPLNRLSLSMPFSEWDNYPPGKTLTLEPEG